MFLTSALAKQIMIGIKDKIKEDVTSHYLQSNDFNGISFRSLSSKYSDDGNDVIATLKELLEEDAIDMQYPEYHPNPYIKAFSGIPKPDQIERLSNKESLHYACAYPSRSLLLEKVDNTIYKGKPYTMELALGAGQLDFRSFELSVLEFYRNDPRYSYKTNDIGGKIYAKDEFYENDSMMKSDRVFLQTFGFSYNKNLDRAVAVFLRYLHDLSPEHQQLWKAKEIPGEYHLHPDYYRNALQGDYGRKISIFIALIKELKIINEMCDRLGKPGLFRNDFQDSKPKGFGFLLRPTLSEYNSFVLLLDQVMSDNIYRKFFENDLSMESEVERSDGKIIVSQKGTIVLLKEWVERYFVPEDNRPIEEMIQVFKKVRKLRMKPAHSVNEDAFDQKYFKMQRELIKGAYKAIRTIRLIFANFPEVKQDPPKISTMLFEGKIWDF